MTWKLHKNKTVAFFAFGLFMVVGTYNAVVINSESHLASSDIKFVKRLDELYGVTVSGREVAASMNWQKLTPKQVVEHKAKVAPQVVQTVSTTTSAPEVSPNDIVPAAAVQEELSLNLVEVINPKKWQQGLNNTQFTGNLSTNQGVIESLNVSLPNGEGVSVSFSEMVGNVFEYDMDGQFYSGMMYQVDQNAYMVTLTNGPLEGTRMRFTTEPTVEEQQLLAEQQEQAQAQQLEQQQVQQELAENHGMNVGNFGQEEILQGQMNPAEQEMQPGVQAEVAQMDPSQQQQYSPEQQDAMTQSLEEQALNYDQNLQQQQQF